MQEIYRDADGYTYRNTVNSSQKRYTRADFYDMVMRDEPFRVYECGTGRDIKYELYATLVLSELIPTKSINRVIPFIEQYVSLEELEKLIKNGGWSEYHLRLKREFIDKEGEVIGTKNRSVYLGSPSQDLSVE